LLLGIILDLHTILGLNATGVKNESGKENDIQQRRMETFTSRALPMKNNIDSMARFSFPLVDILLCQTVGVNHENQN